MSEIQPLDSANVSKIAAVSHLDDNLPFQECVVVLNVSGIVW